MNREGQSGETEESTVPSKRYRRPAALQMLSVPRGSDALCALPGIPSRASFTIDSSASVN